jgi:hypothetical protein
MKLPLTLFNGDNMIIPAKDVAGLILKDIQDAVREEYGPDASAEEINRAELTLFGALGATMFTARYAND